MKTRDFLVSMFYRLMTPRIILTILALSIAGGLSSVVLGWRVAAASAVFAIAGTALAGLNLAAVIHERMAALHDNSGFFTAARPAPEPPQEKIN